jgi:hypothetical protein
MQSNIKDLMLLCFDLLNITPNQFWLMTPKEIFYIFQYFEHKQNSKVITRSQLNDLINKNNSKS